MLQQKQFDSGAVGFVSPLLQHAGIPHLFSTRIGGISSGPFASLNLGNPNGAPIQDAPANLEENYRRTMSAANLPSRRLCRVHQVHGNAIAILSQGDAPPAGTRADALLSDCPDFALSIRTADCVPILIASTDGRLVSAVHAGWRGVVAGIVPEVIAVMQQRHFSPSQLLIAIGPSIGLDAFEVGDEVAQEFRVRMPGAEVVRRRAGEKAHVDLRRAIALQARQAGIPESNLDTTDCCTFRDAELFFSHRRDNGITGRMATFIGTRTLQPHPAVMP